MATPFKTKNKASLILDKNKSIIETQNNRKINIVIEPGEMTKNKSMSTNFTGEKIKRKQIVQPLSEVKQQSSGKTTILRNQIARKEVQAQS